MVNNAGIFTGGPLEQAAVQDLDRILAVGVKAVFLASQAAARHMSDGGRIIIIGSALADRVPGPTLTLYSMAKSALSGLTKGLARDLGPRGIRATLVQAGPIDTDMNPENGPARPVPPQRHNPRPRRLSPGRNAVTDATTALATQLLASGLHQPRSKQKIIGDHVGPSGSSPSPRERRWLRRTRTVPPVYFHRSL